MPESRKDRVLLLAPTGADARNTTSMLERDNVWVEQCRDLDDLLERAKQGLGAVIIAEEALRGPQLPAFVSFLAEQPSWSDLPVLIVTSGGDTTQATLRAASVLGKNSNLILLERPFRSMTLISSVKSALRSRHRQFEVRDLLFNLEEKVRERTLKLEQTISELEAFSYSVSHDLRAPLRSMQGYSHIIKEEFQHQLDSTAIEYLDRIMAASNRLDQLVQDLLTYSKAARGNFVMEKVDLHRLVGEIVQQYPTFQPPNANIIIEGKLSSVQGHEPSLTQCISNLLGNAVKFQQAGSIPKIRIWTESIGNRVKIFFSDNGIGIDTEHQSKIFQIFERGPLGTHYEGTGIGLAIVKKAVERMGGSIGVISQPGCGSTFWFELPGDL